MNSCVIERGVLMHLTRYERETTIHFNEAEDTAIVYTCSKPVMNKLDKL